MICFLNSLLFTRAFVSVITNKGFMRITSPFKWTVGDNTNSGAVFPSVC